MAQSLPKDLKTCSNDDACIVSPESKEGDSLVGCGECKRLVHECCAKDIQMRANLGQSRGILCAGCAGVSKLFVEDCHPDMVLIVFPPRPRSPCCLLSTLLAAAIPNFDGMPGDQQAQQLLLARSGLSATMTLFQGKCAHLYKQEPGSPSWDNFRTSYAELPADQVREPMAVIAQAFAEFNMSSVSIYDLTQGATTLRLNSEYLPSEMLPDNRIMIGNRESGQWSILYRPGCAASPLDVKERLKAVHSKLARDTQRRQAVQSRLTPKHNVFNSSNASQNTYNRPNASQRMLNSSQPPGQASSSSNSVDESKHASSSSSVANLSDVPVAASNSGGSRKRQRGPSQSVWKQLDDGSLQRIVNGQTKLLQVMAKAEIKTGRKSCDKSLVPVIAGSFRGSQCHEGSSTRYGAWRVVLLCFKGGVIKDQFDVAAADLEHSSVPYPPASSVDKSYLRQIVEEQAANYREPALPQPWQHSKEIEDTKEDSETSSDDEFPQKRPKTTKPKQSGRASGKSSEGKAKSKSKEKSKAKPIHNKREAKAPMETGDNDMSTTRAQSQTQHVPVMQAQISQPIPANTTAGLDLSSNLLGLLQRLDSAARENNNLNNNNNNAQSFSNHSNCHSAPMSDDDSSAQVVKAFLAANLIKNGVQMIMRQ